MAIIFDQALANNASDKRNMEAQYKQLMTNRRDPRHALPMTANAGTKPFQLYQEFDDTVVEQFHLDEGDAILSRLMPFGRSLPIGYQVTQGARASDSGKFTQSMTGEQKTIYDGIDYDLDGTIIPIGKNGFKTSWRESQTLSNEGFDDMVHKQREAVRTHKKGVFNTMMDGHRDDQGNLIVVDNLSWAGFRNDSRVDQVDLSTGTYQFNFTDRTQTGPAIYDAFMKMAERRMVENGVTEGATFWVSTSTWWNFQRQYGDNNTQGLIIEQLRTISGVDDIVVSSGLTGNEILSIPLLSKYIALPTGMAVSNIALPRPIWNSPVEFEIVSAIGVQIKNDYGNVNKAVQFASS